MVKFKLRGDTVLADLIIQTKETVSRTMPKEKLLSFSPTSILLCLKFAKTIMLAADSFGFYNGKHTFQVFQSFVDYAKNNPQGSCHVGKFVRVQSYCRTQIEHSKMAPEKEIEQWIYILSG